MTFETFIPIIFILLFVLVVYAFIRLPHRHKSFKENIKHKSHHYQVREINTSKPCKKVIGKLVKKSIDKSKGPSRYSVHINSLLYENKNKDYFWRYYLTFETFEGYKSFTVSKKAFDRYKINTYGYIYYQKKLFSHFELASREELEIDERLRRIATDL